MPWRAKKVQTTLGTTDCQPMADKIEKGVLVVTTGTMLPDGEHIPVQFCEMFTLFPPAKGGGSWIIHNQVFRLVIRELCM